MNSSKILRIGLMGSSCSGKTTSVELLAEELGLKLYPEFESRILSDWISQGRIKDKLHMSPDSTKEFHEEALTLRERKSEESIRYISDRTAAELLAYNRLYVQPHFLVDYAREFTSRCREVMEKYTNLFLFPRGVLPLEDNGVRTADSEYQFKVHTLLVDVLRDLGIRYTILSKDRLDKRERVEEIKKWLEI